MARQNRGFLLISKINPRAHSEPKLFSFHKNLTNSLAFFRFISVMLMYDVLQVGGILKLSTLVWRATANLSWRCHWLMRGRGHNPDAGIWWQWEEQTREEDGTRIVVPRHIRHMPGSGGCQLSWGRGEECRVHRGVICGKWGIKRVELATPDRIQHPASRSNKL